MPPTSTYATPVIPKSDHLSQVAPPPPRTSPATLFTPAHQHDIARSARTILSRPLVEQKPAQAAGALITLLSSSSSTSLTLHPTTPEERLLILQLLRDIATTQYLRAFSHDIRGREILACWLSDATPPRKNDVVDESEKWKETLCPLLHLLRMLPITLEHLKDHVGLGKLITGVQKRAKSEQARQLADEVKSQWSALVSSKPSMPLQRESPPVTLKRSAANPPADQAKRARSSTPPTLTPSHPSTSALSSSSRATAERKASPQLSESRATERNATASGRATPSEPQSTARRTTRSNQAVSSDAHKDLAGFMSLIDQPKHHHTSTSVAEAPKPSAAPAERKKKKKTVHWKDHDGLPLVAVRLIEAAIYDDDLDTSVRGSGALDIEEGGVFRQAHAEMDEQIDWYAPRALQIHQENSPSLPERGAESEAKFAQEERERTLPLSTYASAEDIPESAEEPDEFILSFAAHMPPPKPMRTGLYGDDVPPTTEESQVEAPDFSAMAAMLGHMGPGNPGAVSQGAPMPSLPMNPAMLQSLMQNSQNSDGGGFSPHSMQIPPWMSGMPFGFPFPPPPEVMAQMGGPMSPGPAPHDH
ncbi:hypothetical protein MPSI1_001415 [Malassezia psittaci]|uniref:TFIIS N-terminal domain-containing protein n=1 Tax=Malassezia psittaci TaxID=1821823 RepID=A0AAF0JDT6_9BASI|nr:hypothetical protein MPSI1_001415 [Malassezia psittaci]